MTEIEQAADLDSHHIEGIAREGNRPFSVSLISHITGNLWTGGCIDGVRLPDDFRYVLSLYPWERYTLGPGTERAEVKMYDAGGVPDEDEVYGAANQVRTWRRRGAGQVLVHCQAGLNRSSLVAATSLVLDGMAPVDAIALLRERRCDAVLCNPAFESWLMGTRD